MIKLVDLNRLHEALRADLEGAFRSVVDRGRFILGEEVRKLEADFAAYQGCRHGVGASSGTDALLLALKASGVGPDDEVIVPAMTFCATAEAVCHLGARPVFVDVEAETLGIDPARVEAAISARTKAILPVHLHGWPVPLGPLFALAERSGLAIIEDCAQGHGSSEAGFPVGSRSRAGCFSFFPGKNLGALGDAGMVVTNDSALADRMRALADHGRRSKFSHDEVGYNARLDELQAAFLNVKLPHLEGWNEQRRQLASRYTEALAGLPLQLPPSPSPDRVPSFHLYVVHCESREERDLLRDFLGKQGVETGVHYPVPVHLLGAFQYLGHGPGDFPVAERASTRMLSLPIYPGMQPEEQQTVINSVGDYFAGRLSSPESPALPAPAWSPAGTDLSSALR